MANESCPGSWVTVTERERTRVTRECPLARVRRFESPANYAGNFFQIATGSQLDTTNI